MVTPPESDISLPTDVLAQILSHHDRAVASGEIVYSANSPVIVQAGALAVQFRIASALAAKPSLPRHLARTAANPFLDPDPAVVVADVGPHHRLLLNKFCVVRPQLLVTTRAFASQAGELDAADLAAAWAVMCALDATGSAKFMAIYNCGDASGNSQPHRHLQIFQKPEPDEFLLFPDRERGAWTTRASDTTAKAEGLVPEVRSVEDVPFQAFIADIPDSASLAGIYSIHAELLRRTTAALQDAAAPGPPSYNIVWTRDWMMLVPRRIKGRDGLNANAAGMAGMIWLTREAELDKWQELGVKEHLAYMGLPRSDA